MSLLLSSGNPYEFIAYYSYGANQNAVKYEMSDISLNVFNYEPVWGAIIGTPSVQAPIPQGLYLYESFYWQAPAHGPVQWTATVQQPDCDPLPQTNAVPEPSTLSVVLLAFLVLIVIRFACRPKWGRESGYKCSRFLQKYFGGHITTSVQSRFTDTTLCTLR